MPQLNLVPGKNRKTPYGGYETRPKAESPLSAFGGLGQYINPMKASVGSQDLLYTLGGNKAKQAIFDKAGEEAKQYYQAQTFAKNNPNVEGGDVSKPNLAVGIANADDTNAINTSINNILDKYKDVKDPDVEDISEDVETLKTEENKKKTKITSSKIKSPSSVDDLIEKLDISPSSEKQGDGAEIKGKTKANVNKEEAKVKYNKYSSLMKQYLDKNDDENAANSTLKAHGFNNKDIGEMSAKEKVDEVRNIITEVMGTKDPSKDQGLEDDLKAMNIVMLGLSIAAGESPNALTNIANGAKDYVLRRSKQIKEKRDEEKQLDLLALKTVLGREEKQEDRKHQKEMAENSRKHDLTLFSKKNAFEMNKLAAQQNFQDHINTVNNTLKLKLDDKQTQRHALGLKTQIITLTENLKNKTEIANAQLQQAGDIANMNNETKLLIAENQLESQELRTIIGNLPEGYGFAMIEGKKKGLEGDDLVNYAKEKGQIFAKNPYLTGPDSFRRMVINVVPKIMKEDGVTFEKALENLTKSLKGNTEILKYFPELEKQKIEEITKNIQTNKPKTVQDLGLNVSPGDVLGQDGKPYTGTGPKFIVQDNGTVVKG
tara:strand:- start:196 stop:1998 length:1803 start_codon:yes stop_codon:yes gene_type:complete